METVFRRIAEEQITKDEGVREKGLLVAALLW